MLRSSVLLVAASLACALGFTATPASRPMSGATRLAASSHLVMKAAQEEEKKGLAAFFGGGNKQVEGKVVPTKKGGKAAEEEKEEGTMDKIKAAGTAGIISYVFWEWAFWGVSIPVCIAGYQAATGHWPDFSDAEDQKKLAGEAFAFVNVARFAIPLRIGLALSTTPWVQTNIVDNFKKDD